MTTPRLASDTPTTSFLTSVRESLSLPRSFGISLASLSWVGALLQERRLQLLAYLEGRWGSQDVIACMRVDELREDPPRFRVPLGAWQDLLPALRARPSRASQVS